MSRKILNGNIIYNSEGKESDQRFKSLQEKIRPQSASSIGTVIGTTLRGNGVSPIVNPFPNSNKRPSTSSGVTSKKRSANLKRSSYLTDNNPYASDHNFQADSLTDKNSKRIETYLYTKSMESFDGANNNYNTVLNPAEFLTADDKSALTLGKLVFSTLTNLADLSKKTGENNFFLGNWLERYGSSLKVVDSLNVDLMCFLQNSMTKAKLHSELTQSESIALSQLDPLDRMANSDELIESHRMGYNKIMVITNTSVFIDINYDVIRDLSLLKLLIY